MSNVLLFIQLVYYQDAYKFCNYTVSVSLCTFQSFYYTINDFPLTFNIGPIYSAPLGVVNSFLFILYWVRVLIA